MFSILFNSFVTYQHNYYVIPFIIFFRTGQKHPSRQDSDRLPLISRHSSNTSSEYNEPPKKPPLPALRAPLPGVTSQQSPVVPTKTNITPLGKNSQLDQKGAVSKQPDRCLYQLDKLLHNLEDDIHSSKENILDDAQKSSKGNNTSSGASGHSTYHDRMAQNETSRSGVTAQDGEDPVGVIDPSAPYAKIHCNKKKIESTKD